MKALAKYLESNGLIGVAVAVGLGFMVGGALSQLLEGIVAGIIDPFLGSFFDTTNIAAQSSLSGTNAIRWGAIITLTINVLVVAAGAYLIARFTGLVKVKKKKKTKKSASSAKK